MATTKKSICCICKEYIWKNKNCRSLQNYPTVLEYVLKNKLIDLPMHNSCYMRFFDLKKSDRSGEKRNEADLVTKTVDVRVQTEPLKNHISSTSPTEIILSSNKSPTTASNITTDSASIEQSSYSTVKLLFYRLDRFTKKCCICNSDFHSKRRHSVILDTSIRIQCLIEHYIFIENNSKCCTAHLSNGLMKIHSINKIKQGRSNQCSIYCDELINMFNELKQELKNKDLTINKLKNSPPLNFNDDETFMSDKNCYILTGLTHGQFNDLCSYIPSTTLRTTDVRTPRMAIASLLVKLRLGVSHDTLCTLFGIHDKRRMS